jgi:hypothetical protein
VMNRNETIKIANIMAKKKETECRLHRRGETQESLSAPDTPLRDGQDPHPARRASARGGRP